jgi:hypothetical protein
MSVSDGVPVIVSVVNESVNYADELKANERKVRGTDSSFPYLEGHASLRSRARDTIPRPSFGIGYAMSTGYLSPDGLHAIVTVN